MPTTRRDFLKASLGGSTLLAFTATVPTFLGRSLAAEADPPPTKDTIFVLIQLTGGNDGLNTVVPFADDHYQKSRPTLRLTPSQVLKITDSLGLHPEMRAALPLFEQGQLSIIQGVGYPNSSRDHEDALRDWHTAQPNLTLRQTGWVGRTIDQASHPAMAETPGIFVGPIQTPFILQTERAVVPTITSLDPWIPSKPAPSPEPPTSEPKATDKPARPTSPSGSPLLDFLRHTRAKAESARQRIQAVAQARPPSNDRGYPASPLADNLRTIADLIRANVGLRIYCAELGGGGIGGFDTHAHQAANHGALLRQLTESIAAFVADLRQDKLLERVLLMTFSEFGRTLSENGRRGTDHGAAAPLLLAGANLKGGLIGPHPSLSDLQGDAPKCHTDFRQVYATVLDRWLGFDSLTILGAHFRTLDLFRS